MNLVVADTFKKGIEGVDADTLSLLSYHLASKSNQRARDLITMISAGLGLCTRNACDKCPLVACWDLDTKPDWDTLAEEVDEVIFARASAGENLVGD